MKAIILAAGEGTRMRPLTLKTPKPLLHINGRPVLDYVFDALPEEVTEVVVVVLYLGEQIKSYLGDTYRDKKIFYAVGSEKGNAYSFLAAKEYFAKGERFIFFYGDEFPFRENVDACLQYPLSILIFETQTPRVGGVVLLDENGFIQEIEEKPSQPKSNIIVGGVMVLDDFVFKYEPFPNVKGEYYFTSILTQFVKDRPVRGIFAKNFIGDITTPKDIERVEGILEKHEQ